jgi:receptor protein-tyrosine kinase
MEIKEILAIAWKRRFTFALVVIASVGAATALAYTRTKRYQAQATLAMTPNVRKGQGFVASDDLATLLSTYGAIAQSTSNKSLAAQMLGRPLNAKVAASTTAGTGILQISATSTSPTEAAADAQALSLAFENQIRDNGLLIVQLVDAATVPTTPVQPRPPLIIASGLLLGLGVAFALVLVLERGFGRVESVEDVHAVTPVPVLGHIPRARALRKGGQHLLVWEHPDLIVVQEAFRTLRTSLQFSIESKSDVL